ncbi:hypothetical protein Tco_1096399 [Tanacetum coccineum]
MGGGHGGGGAAVDGHEDDGDEVVWGCPCDGKGDMVVVTRLRLPKGGGGVEAHGMVDRVDQVMRIIFCFGRKIPPEKFSGGYGGGGGRRLAGNKERGREDGESINGFEFSLPVAVCSGVANALVQYYGALITI